MRIIENTPEQGHRDFDLPREHVIDERHYVPPKAYDPEEIERRKELTSGTLLAESQAEGIAIARDMLVAIDEPEGMEFMADILSAAGINTSWYSYAQNASEMRRRLKLPILMHKRSQNPDLVIEDVIEGYVKAEARARSLRDAIEYHTRSRYDHQRRLGVSIGNVSLRLACYDLALHDSLAGYASDDDAGIQDVVRNHCLQTLHTARTLHREVGSHPSIAQLSDPYSHLSVYLHRKAPGQVQKILRRAS